MAIVSNKKLHLHYEIIDTLEAGIELFGFEVKALRNGKGSLDGSKIIIRGGEAFIVGSFIPAHQEKNAPKNFDAYRTRRLLLKKSDIGYIYHKEETKSLTSIPISLYLKKNLIKCDVGLCKKKQKDDKRENIKKDIARRELRAA